MSLTARSRSIPGTLRQEIVIDGKHGLITDEPEDISNTPNKRYQLSTSVLVGPPPARREVRIDSSTLRLPPLEHHLS